MRPRRVLIWVQHLLGTGHLRRALLLAEALARRGAGVLVASGGPRAPFAPPDGVDLLELPAVRAADSRFSRLVSPSGEPVDERLWGMRRDRLEAALASFAPNLLVTEHYPFGRGAFARELGPLLDRAAAAGIPVAASVRDVIVSKDDPAKLRAMLQRAASYRRVLVHGDPGLLPFASSFPLAHELGDRLCHTGYLAPRPVGRPAGLRAEIVVSAGGGAVGLRVLEAAVAARRLLPDRPWRIVTGPALGAPEFARLARAAGPGLAVERYRPDLPELIAVAAVSVSQAGYNTVVETLAAGTPMVLVPFADGAEDEQTRRATALASRGLARVVEERALSPDVLAQAVAAALAGPPPAASAIRLDGAARSAELLLELIDGRRG